ncbi:hypothetical protein MBGDC06_00747 [Thermoplasmatales archaeon SCGC AB-539-C06]|nr:hypothetical protein MBGDC06_00747 [Thermoplasmatales archaeon SCGC AB-539-C06]
MKKLFLASLFLVFLMSVGMVSAADCSTFGLTADYVCSDPISFSFTNGGTTEGFLTLITNTNGGVDPNFRVDLTLTSNGAGSVTFVGVPISGLTFTDLLAPSGGSVGQTSTSVDITGDFNTIGRVTIATGFNPFGTTQGVSGSGTVNSGTVTVPTTSAVPEFSSVGIIAAIVCNMTAVRKLINLFFK